MDIRDKTVVVSGASRGIGQATTEAVAAVGGHPILLARTESDLETSVQAIRAEGGEASAFTVDLSDPDAVDEIAESIRDEVGVPDVIVNNAGIGKWRAIDETSPEEARQIIQVPYLAAFYLTRAFVEGMLARDSGHVVNMTSAAAYTPPAGATAYNASRWAMRGFTESLRGDLRGTNVGVTLVAPGKVDSPYFEHNPGTEERIPAIAEWFRTVTTDQVATAVVDAIEAERRTVILPLEMRLTVFFSRFFPKLVQWSVNVTGWSRE